MSDGRTPPGGGELPNFWQLLSEVRALGELGAFAANRGGDIRHHPDGDGAPVIVLPGFLTSDFTTMPLRSYLKRCGYDVHGWDQGINLGYRAEQFEKLLERVDALAARTGEKVALVGWSLGGLFAREAAKLRRETIALVITLGSPISGDVRANRAWPIYELLNGDTIDVTPSETPLTQPPEVPNVSIYSETDGVVPAANARNLPAPGDGGAQLPNVRVNGSHIGLTWNPEALSAVAEALARHLVRTRPDQPAR